MTDVEQVRRDLYSWAARRGILTDARLAGRDRADG